MITSNVCNEGRIAEAKVKELENWNNFRVYEEVPNEGQKCISVRWVCTEKEVCPGKSVVKARLVARGFDDSGCSRTDSPTISKDVLRIFLALMISNQWQCSSIDVKAAFLQSEDFHREVYLKPPQEVDSSGQVLWKLKKGVYVLNDASREWYLTVRKLLHTLGYVQVKTDPARFYWYDNYKLSGLLLMHVDDFIWGGTQLFENVVINRIREKFKIGQQSVKSFRYIGLDLKQDEKDISLNQKAYMNEIKPITINGGNKDDSLNECATEELRSLIGILCWMCNNTRPDISYRMMF